MTDLLELRLDALNNSDELLSTLGSLQRGIERESLRVDLDGYLAGTPHPPALGSKLCHPFVTTDFSEAQPELITPVATSVDQVLTDLSNIHRFVHGALDDEVLWSASMPCMLQGDDHIPLAHYGPSNLGQLKTTYRNGLGHRYSRLMQTICAVHYNFSVPDQFWQLHHRQEGKGEDPIEFRSRRYFDLMRNFKRHSWLLIYLFGASPVVCNSFLRGRKHSLTEFDHGSMYAPFGTSLRNGDLGYESDFQRNAIDVSYNDLNGYIQSLAEAITSNCQAYTDIGRGSDGEYLQVSDSYLQSEAEFYTTIRAKCVPPPGENFLRILGERGVEYVEVRLLDVNPFLPLGIDAEEIRFLDTFLLHCLLMDSPPHGTTQTRAIADNAHATVYRGRDRNLPLHHESGPVSIADWSKNILEEMAPIARMLDQVNDTGAHSAALQTQMERALDPATTLSARVLAEMEAEEIPYFRFAMNKSMQHREYFKSAPLDAEVQQLMETAVSQSLVNQKRIENSDQLDFGEYLANFVDGYKTVLSDRSGGHNP